MDLNQKLRNMSMTWTTYFVIKVHDWYEKFYTILFPIKMVCQSDYETCMYLVSN